MTAVYCYDLVPTRDKNWTRKMDDYLRAEYFPGLSVAQLAGDMKQRFPMRGFVLTERAVANRLSRLGLRRLKG